MLLSELEEHYLLCYPEPQDVKLVIYCNLAILKKRLTWNNGGQTIRILILTNGLLPSFSKLPNQKADDAAYSGRKNMPTADRKLASESTGHWAQTVSVSENPRTNRTMLICRLLFVPAD